MAEKPLAYEMSHPMQAELRSGVCVAGWRLLRPIGKGTQSTVFLAEPEAGGAAVALKLVNLQGTDERARAAFLAGAETARGLVHSGIVAVLAAGIEGTLGWLAMEPVPGIPLDRYTQPARLLPEAVVLRLAEAVAAALAHAHQRGVVHRDVKPANILVHWPSDTVKLVDFGLARNADAGQTATGIVLGSPAYMAPEQLAGGVPTAACDLYALGVTLYQLLAGRLPQEADNLGELLHRVATGPAPDLQRLRPDLPAPLTALVARLLSRNPADRPVDAVALQQPLRAAQTAISGAKSR